MLLAEKCSRLLQATCQACKSPSSRPDAAFCTDSSIVPCAEEKVHQLALRMNRSALLAEKRSRLLQAIRQTYNDFFHDYFITDDHVFRLRVSCLLLLPILSAHPMCHDSRLTCTGPAKACVDLAQACFQPRVIAQQRVPIHVKCHEILLACSAELC